MGPAMGLRHQHFFAIINRHIKDNGLGNLETDPETQRDCKRCKTSTTEANYVHVRRAISQQHDINGVHIIRGWGSKC